ncbi:ead/Ea22-like family protein [Salmonella enterica subsp. enterica serovar Oranienburg]|nr:ead/Ea22-like family protein [Salmonella enterica]EBG5027462.1 ead/Ea22-like family protein [Salmonella enterica subsp. enterica serovar Oranienburg]EAS1264968.1 ead/Ea22-like family protein [Salmonella enterica]EBB1607790.1 ead/Ea22-like family protein [Salmonella enterica]EBB9534583.1 ead/Ea22-like family protein [Salmonella enterica]
MNIDKRALREVAEKATKGPWKVFSDIDTKTFSIHTPRDKRCENVIKWGGFDCQPNAEANAEFIAAFNPKVALALLDELEAETRYREGAFIACNRWHDKFREADDKLAAAERRIEELERSETQLINERDYAESALNDAYKAVMGQAPEWSNWFSFENAIEEIELACELWRNQTDDVIQFRQRIQELEAREITLPQRLQPGADGYDDWYVHSADDGEYLKADDVIEAIRAAGIKVKGD